MYEDSNNQSLSFVVTKLGQRLADGSWHHVTLIYTSTEVNLAVDYRRPQYVQLNSMDGPVLTLNDESWLVVGVGYFDSQPGESHTFF